MFKPICGTPRYESISPRSGPNTMIPWFVVPPLQIGPLALQPFGILAAAGIFLAGKLLVSEAERRHFKNIVQLGLHDSFRLFEQAEKSYSWWDYRMVAFRRNHGLRIDHILISEPLVASCKSCVIDKAPRKLERPSDHTPVVVEL